VLTAPRDAREHDRDSGRKRTRKEGMAQSGNKPYDISDEDMYSIFGRYGAIRQVRRGDKEQTKGTAYVVYEDIYDARNAQSKLSGYNLQNRYLIVGYHHEKKRAAKLSIQEQEEELRRMQQAAGVDGEQH
jgi:pre-mRNA branch site protein p14